jgi:hypothetical protein
VFRARALRTTEPWEWAGRAPLPHRPAAAQGVIDVSVVSRRNVLAGATAALVGVPAVSTPPPTPASEYEAGTVTAWFDLMLELIKRTPGYTPPVAARALGYAGVTLYEALIPGMPEQRSLVGTLNGLSVVPATGRRPAFHWPTVAGAALAGLFRELFVTAPPPLRAEIDMLEAMVGAAAPRGVRDRSAERGRQVAQAIVGWSHDDGGHEGYLRNFPADYDAPSGPGLWVPTPPGYQRALQPTWGENRCLALTSADVCPPGPPPAYSADAGSAFYAEAVEVYEAVNQISDEQLEIARFWADNPATTATPPGHSVSITSQVLRQRTASLETAAGAYARVGIAVADAFIACWRTKYRYNLVRPITYINEHIDPNWGSPLPVVTPPFPEYTSGHSVQSAAAATVLTELFGRHGFTDSTHADRGLPSRSFGSFNDFAEEAAISRLYGGIHYQSAIQAGLRQGECIGHAINVLPWHR